MTILVSQKTISVVIVMNRLCENDQYVDDLLA